MPTTARSIFLFVACAVLIPLLPGTAMAWNLQPSQPSSAVFYPGEVQVTVEENLTPDVLPTGGSGFMIALPPRVQRESFLVSVNGSPAGGYYWLEKEEREMVLAARGATDLPSGAFLPENETSPERRALLEKIVAVAEEAAQREGDFAATNARLELWQKSLSGSLSGNAAADDSDEGRRKRKAISPDDLAKLDAAFTRHLPGLYLDRDRQKRALDDAGQRLEKARTALRDYDMKDGCEIAVIPYTGGEKGSLRLRYGYVLPAACTISYRLSAQPEKETLIIDQDVALVQTSGFTWDAADTFVSTLRRDRTLKPFSLNPWKISLEPKFKPAARMQLEDSAAELPRQRLSQSAVNRLPMGAAPSKGAVQPGPYQEDRATFRMWSLGKQRIEHKTPMRLSLASNSYKARYYYTLRPISNPKGFLTAALALPSAIELPPGPAQFSVDGVSVGQQQFSFNGDKGIIFFGSDPQVTATVHDLNRSSGEQGFISKEQTLSWHWQITLKSTRPKPVDVMLEDPVPDTFDESVTIKAESRPKPEQAVNPPEHGGAKVYRWKTTLKSGESFVVDHKVQAVAPKTDDKELNPGRGGRI